MTHIFNLADNTEDLQEKIDLDELYEKKRVTDLNNLDLFNKILNRIHHKIKKTSQLCKDATWCWFVVPEVMIGIPKYDHAECIGFLVEKLRENGFNIRYFHPNTILISWGHWIPSYVRTEIKKKLNKNIDGFGNIVEEKKEETNANLFGSKSKKESEKDYKSTSSYKPSGKFIYNTDFFK
tara:strand:+ start:137 stop:676 length:540 start_codon:yes stop_codon:yes gene_type:complete